MKERIGEAIKNYNAGYNCAQAILCAYSSQLNMSSSDAYKLGEGFGRGRCAACGALAAAVMVISHVYSDGVLGSKKSRSVTHEKVEQASSAFKTKYGSMLCRDILLNAAGVGCVQKVYDAAEILENILEDKPAPVVSVDARSQPE